jgi:hypothetical protein
MRSMFRAVPSLWLLCSPISTALAQVGTEGSIVGQVLDSTGASVARATVTVVNLETGLRRETVSNNEGQFEVLLLPRGFYSVTTSLPGFKTWNLGRAELALGERRRVSPVLDPGTVSERIEVQAVAELMQTEKASLESTIMEKQIRQLPLNGRNPLLLVNLVPGMRVISVSDRSSVAGVGLRDDRTEFEIDGVSVTNGHTEGISGVPNSDAIGEMNIQTLNFSAEQGRQPLQVDLAIKSGTNQFHGTLWEFLRNEKLDAFNTFAKRPGARKPKVARNQFGGTVGGPIVRDKTHFFASVEATRVRSEQVYNSLAVRPEMLQGDFSALPRAIVDPLNNNAPFAANRIPAGRVSPASRFFAPYVLTPNAADGTFKALGAVPNDSYEIIVRLDHQISNKQRLSGRWIKNNNTNRILRYKPDVFKQMDISNHSAGLTYNWSINPTTLLTATAGIHIFDTVDSSPLVGDRNFATEAGLQGFPTAGREGQMTVPFLNFTGYTGVNYPDTPRTFLPRGGNAKVATNLIRGTHSLSFGYDFNDKRFRQRYVSAAANGSWTFNNQYTGDGFADFLLGLPAQTQRNFPIELFGTANTPYSALYLQDFWKMHPRVTISAGLRFDYWHEKAPVRGIGTSFDPALGKAIAAEDHKGQVDLTAIAVSRFFAAAFPNSWVPASQAKAPRGLVGGRAYLSPRIGAAWRLTQRGDFVVRASYGLFTGDVVGNSLGSSVVGLPYWALETLVFTRTAPQRWETAWPANPAAFANAGNVQGPAIDAAIEKIHQWNISIQKELPFKAAVTISYVGTRGVDLFALSPKNEVAPGTYANLQAARPYPVFANINLYSNVASSNYHAGQLRVDRRFSGGLSFGLSYSRGKQIDEGVGNAGAGRDNSIVSDFAVPFAPAGYNRGRSGLDRKHVLSFNGVWEVPAGHGRRYLGRSHRAVDLALGGWQVSTIYQFISGRPLTVVTPGATLGNGLNTRANLVGDPRVDSPVAARWFNPAAFAAPARVAFGNSGIGILDGPGFHGLDVGLMKNIRLFEGHELQFRAESFNAVNHVNLGTPGTQTGTAPIGQILSAGSARQMQLALKYIF